MEKRLFIFSSKMFVFIRKIIIVFISILCVYFISDIILSYCLRHSHLHKYDTWTKIVNSEFQNYDLLIFGSSRAWVQYSPTILDSILGVNSYNFGMDDSALDRQIMRWNLYKLYGNRKPKYIIHDVGYIRTLEYSLSGFERDQFFPYVMYRGVQASMCNEIDKMSLQEIYIPFYRYMNYGVKNVFKRDPYVLTKGYEGLCREWDGTTFQALDSLKFEYNKDVEALFETHIEKLLSDSIQVILVMSPMYYCTKEKFSQINLMYYTYRQLSKKYNLPLLDYTFCDISKDSLNFYNATHLNKIGSEKFSIQLANDINILGLLKQ